MGSRPGFGLRKLSPQESGDFYDVLVERDRHAANAITSNRAVDEWVAVGAAAAAASGCNAMVTRTFRRARSPVIDAATGLAWLTVDETGGATT